MQKLKFYYALLCCVACFIAPASALASLRLIVLDSTTAEIIIALGAQDQIIATSSSADFLPELTHSVKLPGFKQGSSETLFALKPTHIVQTSERLQPQTRAQLVRLGINIIDLNDESTLSGAVKRIHLVGELLGRTAEAMELATHFSQQMAELQQEVQAEPLNVKGVFILAGGGRPTVAGGRDTHAAALLALAGVENIADAIQGYKIMSQEALVATSPDFILTNQEGLHTDQHGLAAVLKAPGVQHTTAYTKHALFSLPGRYLQGVGLSTPTGVRLLRSQIKQVLQEHTP